MTTSKNLDPAYPMITKNLDPAYPSITKNQVQAETMPDVYEIMEQSPPLTELTDL